MTVQDILKELDYFNNVQIQDIRELLQEIHPLLESKDANSKTILKRKLSKIQRKIDRLNATSEKINTNVKKECKGSKFSLLNKIKV